jgi:1-acyl-sn-glycerol-3-phosphate acyltransferase
MISSFIKIVLVIILTIVISTLAILSGLVERSGNLYHWLAKRWSQGILFVCGIKLEVAGLDRLDRKRNYIYISNHASQLDIPSIIAGIPDQIRIVYKRELTKIPIFGWSLGWNRTYIGIDRARGHDAVQSLEKAAEKIRTGTSVLLFAEGTRSVDGRLQPFRRGPFNLAVKSGVPVVPVSINGSHRALPKHSMRITPGTIRLRLGDPIQPPPGSGKENELTLRDMVHEVIQQNLEVPG